MCDSFSKVYPEYIIHTAHKLYTPCVRELHVYYILKCPYRVIGTCFFIFKQQNIWDLLKKISERKNKNNTSQHPGSLEQSFIFSLKPELCVN